MIHKMADNPVLERNLEGLRARDSTLAGFVLEAISDGAYAEIRISKSGFPVPVSNSGIAYHSLYDPKKEAATLASSLAKDAFILFAGIAGAFHIRAYLSLFPESRCMLAEAGYPSFRSLVETVDISDLLSDPRVTLLPDCTDERTAEILRNAYLPALDGDFRLVPLRSWQNRFSSEFSLLETRVQEALNQVSADFSVQVHFGRLWFRNCLENLAIAGTRSNNMPHFDTSKTAIIAAAGPGLEASFESLREHRERLVIFATDTAFSSLAQAGIMADVFVSIDPQSVSARHVMHSLPATLTVIMDVCGNPAIARRACACGCSLVFASGGHPLARYVALFSALPLLDTGSGTVTIAALDAAGSLGFTEVRLAGADFRYTGGKPYCRGTYLADSFGTSSSRLVTEETLYTALMFRSPVTRSVTDGIISYSTATLDRYADSCARFRSQNRWEANQWIPFPSSSFFLAYRNALEKLVLEGVLKADRDDPILCTLLPLIAWNGSKNTRPGFGKTTTDAINLALALIARYTEVS